MRSLPGDTFQHIANYTALWRAWLRFAQGKRLQPAVATFDIDADRRLLHLERGLLSSAWRPSTPRVRVVHDPKPRLIVAYPVPDRVLHQAVIGAIAPFFERRFSTRNFACCTGRGPQRAVQLHLQLQRRHRWRLALDVHSYFPTVRHDTLIGLYDRHIRCRRTVGLIEHILRHAGRVYTVPDHRRVLGCEALWKPGRGLAIGTLVSHFSGALYLDAFDHHVQRRLRAPGYIRYMDDFVLFDDDEQRLRDHHAAVIDWLWTERGLRLKPARVTSTRAPALFLGWRVKQSGMSVAPKLLRNLRRRVRVAMARGPEALRRTLASYRGLLKRLPPPPRRVRRKGVKAAPGEQGDSDVPF